MSNKPILALDFDGCIHQYSRGWQQGQIYDPVMPGFFEWAVEAAKHFRLVIHSSRAANDYGAGKIRDWLSVQALNYGGPVPHFEVSNVKPPAWVTIDDRAIQFQGSWDDPALSPEALAAFKPWNQR